MSDFENRINELYNRSLNRGIFVFTDFLSPSKAAEVKRLVGSGATGGADPLDRHHIFPGTANRKKSEKYGLVVYLCHNRCHIFGRRAVHNNATTMKQLQRYGQLKAMQEQGWTEEDFRREFGKSYL